MTRDPTRKYSIINSWGGLAGTLVAAFFFFAPLTHARPKCESQGVWGHLVTKSPRSPSPISLVYGFHQAWDLHASSQIPNPGFCFTQYRGRDNCSLFILTLLFPRKQGLGDRGHSQAGLPQPGLVLTLCSHYTCCYRNDSITRSKC